MNHFPSIVDGQLSCLIPQEKKQILNYFKLTFTSIGILISLWKVKSQMSDRNNSDLIRCTRKLKETHFAGVTGERNKEQGGDQIKTS